MPIEGFDHKAFAIDLAKQAQEILNEPESNLAPNTLTKENKHNIVKIVKKFCLMSADALVNDEKLDFTAEQASFVTQYIGEWTFHKSIDLIKCGLNPQKREEVLQVIAAHIFNIAKLGIIKELPQETITALVEEKVKEVYQSELQKLLNGSVINQKQYKIASCSSNFDDMTKKVQSRMEIKFGSKKHTFILISIIIVLIVVIILLGFYLIEQKSELKQNRNIVTEQNIDTGNNDNNKTIEGLEKSQLE